MKRFFLTILLCVALGCTAAVTAEFAPKSLTQLQQLNHKPELFLAGETGDFLITPDTRVEIVLRGGEVLVAYAAQVLTNNDTVIIKGTGQLIPFSSIERVRYISIY